MDDGPYWVILLMYGSHDMRHTGFRRLTVVNGTPGFWGVTAWWDVPVHMCRKLTVAKVYRYIIKVYRYICMGIARFDQEFELNVRALLLTNQNGKITLEGGIKGRGKKEEASFDF